MLKAMSRSAVVLAGLAAIGAQAQTTVDLTGLGFVQYGDAQSYSMPVANLQFGFNTNNGPFAIDSTPGAIKNLTVLGTGSEGGPVTVNNPRMDDAYSTPSGVGGLTYYYSDPDGANKTYRGTNGTVNNNGDYTWDASLKTLKDFLAGEKMAVFFNNNQVNSGGSANQELAAWARIWITDDQNNVVSGSTVELTNNVITGQAGGKYDLVSMGGGGAFFGNVANYTASGSGAGNPVNTAAGATDFVLSGGAVCVAYTPGSNGIIPVPVPCGSPVPPALAAAGYTTVSGPLNHNLGADHVAYTLLFPELNAKLAGLFDGSISDPVLGEYTIHFDVRLGCNNTGSTDPAPDNGAWMSQALANGHGTCLNNGYEQIFIGTAKTDGPNNETPEPESLALVAFALTALGLVSRRRQTAKRGR